MTHIFYFGLGFGTMVYGVIAGSEHMILMAIIFGCTGAILEAIKDK